MTGGFAGSGEALPDREPPTAADMWVIARGCTEMLIGSVKAGCSIIFLATLARDVRCHATLHHPRNRIYKLAERGCSWRALMVCCGLVLEAERWKTAEDLF